MKKIICLFFTFTLVICISFSQTVEELLKIGDRYILEGQLHEARLVVKETIRLNPNNAISYFHLGSIYYRLGNITLAMKSFSRVIELDNYFAEAYFWRAVLYDEYLNDYTRAICNYNMAIYLEPENDRFHRGRGVFLYTVVGNFESAFIDLNRAVEIDSLNYLNFLERGEFHSTIGRFEIALDDFNAAIKLNAEYTRIFSNKGVTLAFLGRYEEAIENFDIALQLDNSNYIAYFERGSVHFELGMYNEAVLDFTEVIRLNPNFRDYRYAYINRAHSFRRLAGQTDDPVQAFYYLNMALQDEEIVTRFDGQRE